jgi:hypothetical protein
VAPGPVAGRERTGRALRPLFDAPGTVIDLAGEIDASDGNIAIFEVDALVAALPVAKDADGRIALD